MSAEALETTMDAEGTVYPKLVPSFRKQLEGLSGENSSELSLKEEAFRISPKEVTVRPKVLYRTPVAEEFSKHSLDKTAHPKSKSATFSNRADRKSLFLCMVAVIVLAIVAIASLGSHLQTGDVAGKSSLQTGSGNVVDFDQIPTQSLEGKMRQERGEVRQMNAKSTAPDSTAEDVDLQVSRQDQESSMNEKLIRAKMELQGMQPDHGSGEKVSSSQTP